MVTMIAISCGGDANEAVKNTPAQLEQAGVGDLADKMVSTDSGGITLYVLLALAAFFFISGVLFLFMPFDLWIKAISSKVWIWPLTLVRMRIQKIDLPLIIDNLITARKSGLNVSINELESMHLARVDVKDVVDGLIMAYNGHIHVTLKELKSHFLSGGSVHKVVHAMVAAHSADMKLEPEKQIHLSFKTAASIDHAGINVLEAIENYIKPKVVETDEINAIARDGIELTARVRITIRTNIKKIVFGADEETIKAQVNEKVVSIIGHAVSHKEILENAYEVGEKVMREKEELFRDTAFDILSVDISTIKVGKDIHAALDAEKASAKLAQEKAREQEMKNLLSEAKIHHLHAESEVQKAMAEAFRDGQLSIKEYHNLMNTEADTIMRKSFSNPPVTDPKDLKK